MHLIIVMLICTRAAYVGAHETSSEISLKTMELQWLSYVSNLKKSGTLSNALAVCDVSGSMSGLPMQVRLSCRNLPHITCSRSRQCSKSKFKGVYDTLDRCLDADLVCQHGLCQPAGAQMQHQTAQLMSPCGWLMVTPKPLCSCRWPLLSLCW